MFHFRLAREDELPQVAELLDDSFQDYSFFDLLCEKVSNRSASLVSCIWSIQRCIFSIKSVWSGLRTRTLCLLPF